MARLRERMQAYLFKAIKEAKVNTSWIQDEPAWEGAVSGFVGDVLSLPPRHLLWKAFLPFARRIAVIGMYNSLSQLALKLTAPGVPDFYQGTELWDLSLVDPDNRRPVDFGPRARLLAEMREQLHQPDARARLFAEVLGSWEDGRIKLLLTNLLLLLRRDHPELFGEGGYRALTPFGPRADKLVAFAREQGRQLSITVAPRLVAGLLEGDARWARLPLERFAGTLVPVPGLRPGDRVRDALTLELRTLRAGEQGAVLAADELFGSLPVAVLIGEVPG
jgi:(1->4)-alpha-D-glucan 1-alpha-D-glucosylmutase